VLPFTNIISTCRTESIPRHPVIKCDRRNAGGDECPRCHSISLRLFFNFSGESGVKCGIETERSRTRYSNNIQHDCRDTSRVAGDPQTENTMIINTYYKYVKRHYDSYFTRNPILH
jgi:hypothetical protein